MLEVMKSYGQDRVEDPKTYLAMTVDINIFDRIVKVNAHRKYQSSSYMMHYSPTQQMMYDMSGGGLKLRTFTSVGLAWWHSYKHGVGSIWKAFANTIWGPLWQRLYPGATFYSKARSPQEGSIHLLYMMKAYPMFRSLLEEALLDGDVNEAGKSMLKNIQFLCEYAIPVVAHHTRT